MTIVADAYRFVVGVDTHARTHSYGVISTATGAVVAQITLPTTVTGITRALAWITHHTGDQSVVISAEGTGSYGAGLARAASAAGYRVVEAPTPSVARIRGTGKTDPADAILAARTTAAQPLTALRDRRADGDRAAVQALLTRRDQLTTARTATLNALLALLRVHDLGIDARHGLSRATIRQIAAWRARHEPDHMATIRTLAIDYAREIGTIDHQLKTNEKHLRGFVTRHVPELLTLFGVGIINAAIIYTVWSHPGRIRTAAAFAAIAGTSPIPVHSGNTHAHRLNRGGDRRLNRALHSIMISRCRLPETQDYITRRCPDGKNKKRAYRALKTYLARTIWRTLNQAHPAASNTPHNQPEPMLIAA